MTIQSASKSLTVAAALVVTAAVLPAHAEVSAVPGHVIVARTEGKALVIWDSTSEVAAIVKEKSDDVTAKLRLERDTLNVLAAEQPKLAAATSISVRVIYSKSGDVSPIYGSPTFAGVERYATLTLAASDLKTDRDKWREAASGTAALPGWIDFTISGELPPR